MSDVPKRISKWRLRQGEGWNRVWDCGNLKFSEKIGGRLMSKKAIGTVKWFNSQRGYGFIVDENDVTEQFFVHFSSINMNGYKELKEGQKVEFALVITDKGVQATDVNILE